MVMTVSHFVTMDNKKYEIIDKIEEGSFGAVYGVYCERTHSQYAVKVSLKPEMNKSLMWEYDVVKSTNDFRFIPKMIGGGFIGPQDEFAFIVMEILGTDLRELHPGANGGFTLRTTLYIAQEVLKGLESLHRRGVIHNDLKLENIALSYNNPRIIKIFDFGLAEEFVNQDGTHKPSLRASTIIGTDLYNSLRKDCGMTATRKDDIETFIYVIMECHRMLPWHYDEDRRVIKEKKYEVLQLDRSVALTRWPSVFKELLRSVLCMDLFEKPPYGQMLDLISEARLHLRFPYMKLDWE